MLASGRVRSRNRPRTLAVCAALLLLPVLATGCGDGTEDGRPAASDQGAVGELLRAHLPCTEVTYFSPRKLAKLQARMGGIDGAGTCDTEEGEYYTDFLHIADMRLFLQHWASLDPGERGARSMMIGRDFGVQPDRGFEKKLLEAGLLYLYCPPTVPPKGDHTVIPLEEGCVASNAAPA